jgi:outer membrane protein assembly factor BamB
MSPIIVDGMAVAHLGSETNGAIVAYDLATGGQKWQWTGDGPGYDSPVLLTLGGSKYVVTQTNKKIVALNTADGKVAWQMDYVAKGMSQNTATPVLDGQTVIYGAAGRGTAAVKLEKNGDTITATPVWSNPDLSPRFTTPVLKDGFLYGLTGRGQFYCLNAQTGKTAWLEDGEGRGGGFGSIIDAGPVLLALTPKQELIAFQPSDKNYTQVAAIKVADNPTYSYPIVAGKRIFVEDQDYVTLWTLE